MLRARYLVQVSILGGTICVIPGCLSLQFGGKTQTVDSVVTDNPATLKRIDELESRVESLERQLAPPVIPAPAGLQSL